MPKKDPRVLLRFDSIIVLQMARLLHFSLWEDGSYAFARVACAVVVMFKVFLLTTTCLFPFSLRVATLSYSTTTATSSSTITASGEPTTRHQQVDPCGQRSSLEILVRKLFFLISSTECARIHSAMAVGPCETKPHEGAKTTRKQQEKKTKNKTCGVKFWIATSETA
jgi:hypothetical protein